MTETHRKGSRMTQTLRKGSRMNFQLMECVRARLTSGSWNSAQLGLHGNPKSLSQCVPQHTCRSLNTGGFHRGFSLVLLPLPAGITQTRMHLQEDIYLLLLLISEGANYLLEELFEALKQDVAVVAGFFLLHPRAGPRSRNEDRQDKMWSLLQLQPLQSQTHLKTSFLLLTGLGLMDFF